MLSYRNVLQTLILVLWVRVYCQDAPKTGYIPKFICDYDREQLEQQTSCIKTILPSDIVAILTEKIAKLLKGRDMYDFLQEVCRKTPKLLLHGKRALLQAVPKPNRPIFSATIDACMNATLFYMPLISKTKYEDLE